MSALKKIYRFFASYGLATVLFILMFFLILFGTLFQVDNGLFLAQKNYFESFYVIHHIGPLAIPLVGGYTLMAVFAVAIICGMLRIHRSWNRAGLIISHFGVLVLIASAAITYYFSDRGHMRLYPNEQSDEFQSYNDWDIEIGKPAAGASLRVIPDKEVADLTGEKSRTFFASDLQFEVTVKGYAHNAMALDEKVAVAGATSPVVDGYRLFTLPDDKQAELNVPGAYVSVKDKTSGATTEGIIWGMAREPLTVKAGDGVLYTIGLERKKYRVPFTVHLDKFDVDFHPNTSMASNFKSHITKMERGQDEKVDIYMNHPLRHHGLTFFQASWGPEKAQPGDTLYTVFEVVRNPADQGPLVACIIVGAGLLIHFVQKLFGYMRAEGRRRLA